MIRSFSNVLFLLVLLIPAGKARALDDLLQYAFVASEQSREVVVVDTDTNTVAERITLSSVPDSLLLSENSRKMITASLGDRTLTIISLDSLQEEAVIQLDFAPRRIRLGSEGRLLVAGNSEAGRVSIIDLQTGRETRRLEGLEHPDFFVFDRDETQLFVASANGSKLTVVDIASGDVSREVSLQGQGAGRDEVRRVTALARTPGGQLAFVLNPGAAAMDVIDMREHALIERVRLPGDVDRVYPSANNQYLIIPDNASGDVSVFSTWSLRTLGEVPGAPGTVSVSIALFDSVAFVVSREKNSVLAFDIDERQHLADIALPGKPVDSVISADGTRIYVATQDPGQLVVINAITLKTVALVAEVGERPVDVVTVRDLSYCH